jgi:succinate-acetate transporter protein
MEWIDDGEWLPRVAASLLLAIGALTVLFSVAIFAVPFPPEVVSVLPGNYKLLLAVLAISGGIAHVLAGIWTRNRRPLFRIAAVVLFGMVLLQVTAPVDVLILVILGLSRDKFEDTE